jgi:hypothetical protein
MSKRDADVLSDAIGRAVDIFNGAVSIAPDKIAKGAIEIIGFDYATHNAGWHGCYQHLLQLARERLRRQFDPKERAALFLAGQLELFGETLQDRYPRKPRRDPWTGAKAEPEYVLRDHLNEDDRWFNIDRLDLVAGASAKHRDALRGETENLFGPRKGVA